MKKRKKEKWVFKIGIYFIFRRKNIEGRAQLFKDKYTSVKLSCDARKPVFGAYHQVRHKQTSTVTEEG